MRWYTSKTVWAAVIIGAIHAASVVGVLSPDVVKVIEGVAIAVFGLGVRQAIAKNGENK